MLRGNCCREIPA